MQERPGQAEGRRAERAVEPALSVLNVAKDRVPGMAERGHVFFLVHSATCDDNGPERKVAGGGGKAGEAAGRTSQLPTRALQGACGSGAVGRSAAHTAAASPPPPALALPTSLIGWRTHTLNTRCDGAVCSSS